MSAGQEPSAADAAQVVDAAEGEKVIIISQSRLLCCAVGVVDLQAYGLGLGLEAKYLVAHLAAPA